MEAGTKLAVISLLLGIRFSVFYDALCIFRGIVRHKRFIAAIEDFAFWCYVFVTFFFMLYHVNNASMRWFVVVGAALGMGLYHFTISDMIVKTSVIILRKLLEILYKIYLMLMRPVWMVWGQGKKKTIRAAKTVRLRAQRGSLLARAKAKRAAARIKREVIRKNAALKVKSANIKVKINKEKRAFKKWKRKKSAKLKRVIKR